MTSRRDFLEAAGHACGAAALLGAAATAASAAEPEAGPSVPLEPGAGAPQRFLLIGLVGSENPTRANFPFAWGAALHEAGHEVRIELAGDATVLMRTTVANSMTPVGWPPFSEALAKVVGHKIPIFV